METMRWRDRSIAWDVRGKGPPVVMVHGTPFAAWVWDEVAASLAAENTVHTWDLAGFGRSSKEPGHAVDLVTQAELLAALLQEWGLWQEPPHVVAHDIGGAVALGAHLCDGVEFRSLTLLDAVARRPWGSELYRLIQEHHEVFQRLPAAFHRALVSEYVAGCSAFGLDDPTRDRVLRPWLGEEGQAAFYRQIAQVVQADTDRFEGLLGRVRCPVQVHWGEDDAWLPLPQGRDLAAALPGAELAVIKGAGHLVQLDRPVEVVAALREWIDRTTPR